MPKKFREEIKGAQMILSRGFEGCIWGYDKKRFEEESRKQLEISPAEERARVIRRYLFSGSAIVELDDQGRFVIPSHLLSYAGVGKEVAIIGAGDYFEVWDKKSWEKYLEGIEKNAR